MWQKGLQGPWKSRRLGQGCSHCWDASFPPLLQELRSCKAHGTAQEKKETAESSSVLLWEYNTRERIVVLEQWVHGMPRGLEGGQVGLVNQSLPLNTQTQTHRGIIYHVTTWEHMYTDDTLPTFKEIPGTSRWSSA